MFTEMIKNHIAYNEESNYKFKQIKAQGSLIWIDGGKELIDFSSAWNVTNLGWHNQEIDQAMINEIKKNDYLPGYADNDIQIEYAFALLNSLPRELDVVCKATGGTEANEEALRIAWTATGRKKIISFKNTYHGQSLATLNLGYSPDYLSQDGPVISDYLHIDFPQKGKSEQKDKENLDVFLKTLGKLLKKKDIAAVFTEAGIISGWGSTAIAPNGYLTAVRKLTNEYRTLLIVDEVGTGFSRCGKLFAIEIEKIVPDIITFAKGISNGAAPIGACVTRKKLVQAMINKSQLYSTFGWNPVACAAALKTLKIHKRDKVWEIAEKNGKYIIKIIQESLKNYPKFTYVRGLGMEIGVGFINKNGKPNNLFASRIVQKAFNNGLHLTLGGNGNIQIMPPLTIPKDLLDRGIAIFIDAVKSTS